MIINRFNIKIFAISTLLVVILNGEGYSQGTDINTSGQQKHFYIGISPGFGISGLKITGASEISSATAEGKGSFTTTLDLGFSFNRYIGISTGIGFSSVTSAISLESYSASITVSMSDEQTGKAVITIISPSGRKVLEVETDKATEDFSKEIPVDRLGEGVYFIRVTLDKVPIYSSKIMIIK